MYMCVYIYIYMYVCIYIYMYITNSTARAWRRTSKMTVDSEQSTYT